MPRESLGMVGASVAKVYGTEFFVEYYRVLLEVLGRAGRCLPWQTLVMGALIARWPNEVLRGCLAAISAGRCILSHAFLTETGGLECRPHNEGHRHSGTIGSIPFAEQNEWLLVPVASDEPLLVWLSPASDGVTLASQVCTAGEPRAQLQLESVDIAAEQVQARGEAARQRTQWVRERLLAAQCSQAVGTVDTMLELTASYSRERHQFGRPIGSFQAVGQRAADRYIDRQCLHLIVDQLVALLSAEQTLSQELAVAKVWCADVLHRSSQSAQHLHGGMGVDRDYPLFRYCLWAKQLELNFGGAAPWLARLGSDIAREFKDTVGLQ